MHCGRGIFKRVTQFGDTLPQGGMDFLAVLNLALKRPDFLLEEQHGVKVVLMRATLRWPLSSRYVRMLGTDFQQGLPILLLGEQMHRIGAEEMKVMFLSKLVPEPFEAQSCLALVARP